jgi:hypothetical protein
MNYKVLVYCDYCDRTHPTGLTVDLTKGPETSQTVAKFFRNKRLPKALSEIFRNAILCRESGKSVMLRDRANVHLIPSV